MSDEDILETFTHILRDILMDDSIVLSMETRREDVPKWDSMNYINFIVAVEMELRVKFKVADVESFEKVGRSWPRPRRCSPRARSFLLEALCFDHGTSCSHHME